MRPGPLAAATLCAAGLLLALLALAAVPLGLGGPGFGYKKLLLLLFGLECAGCGLLLWRRCGAPSSRRRLAEKRRPCEGRPGRPSLRP